MRWIAGETAGFAVAASAGALVRLADAGLSLTYGLMVLAGAGRARTALGAGIAICAVAGFLMATTVALITGWEVIRLRPLQAYAIADGGGTIRSPRSKASLSS